jgi:hypothetical protein
MHTWEHNPEEPVGWPPQTKLNINIEYNLPLGRLLIFPSATKYPQKRKIRRPPKGKHGVP